MLKNVLVTGANGYLGNVLIETLLQCGYCVTAVTSDAKSVIKKFPKVNVLLTKNFFREEILLKNIDVVIHCAFARRDRGNSEIASSLIFGERIFQSVVASKIPCIINISSQGVYGNTQELRTEKTLVAPEMPYTMAKYASEVILESICKQKDSITRFTNIRLDSIAENQNITRAFVKQAVETKSINIIGGNQVFSFMSGKDFASAMMALLQVNPQKWGNVYNVGFNNKKYTIVELANIAATIAKKYLRQEVKVNIERRDIELYAGMNSSYFFELTNWKPNYTIDMIFDDMFKKYIDSRVGRDCG